MPDLLDRPGIVTHRDTETEFDPTGSDSFPDDVWVILYKDGRNSAYCHFDPARGGEVHGIACFSSEGSAWRFNEHVEGLPSTEKVEEMKLDEALNLAAAKPAPCVCLMLVDDLHAPKIRYVK